MTREDAMPALRKYMLEVEHIGGISDEMREVVQSEWPEVAHTAVCSISPSLARNELRGFLHDQFKLVFDGSSPITNTPVAGKKNVHQVRSTSRRLNSSW